jgi:hypothetical protein
MLITNLGDGFAQGSAYIFITQKRTTPVGDNSKKVGGAGSISATVARHILIVTAWATSCPPYRAIYAIIIFL